MQWFALHQQPHYTRQGQGLDDMGQCLACLVAKGCVCMAGCVRRAAIQVECCMHYRRVWDPGTPLPHTQVP